MLVVAFKERQQQPTVFFSGADNCSLTDPVRSKYILFWKEQIPVLLMGQCSQIR